MRHIKQWTWHNNVLSRIDWSLFGMKWKWVHNSVKWNHFYNEFTLQLIRSEWVTVFATVDARGMGWLRCVILFVFSQITTGMLHHSPPPHPTCTLPPSRVRPAPTSPSISRPARPTASFWKTWATLTSFAWSSNVRCIRVFLCVHFSPCLSLQFPLSLFI